VYREHGSHYDLGTKTSQLLKSKVGGFMGFGVHYMESDITI
jgi:hypothetical protein